MTKEAENVSGEELEKVQGNQFERSSENAEQDTLKDLQENKPESTAKWIDNEGQEIEEVFGFNKNAELVNGRVAMVGFFMLVLTELIYKGEPVTKSIFGIN